MKSEKRTQSSMMLKRFLALTVLAALCVTTFVSALAAEPITFSYTFDKVVYTLGDQISLDYTISGGSGVFTNLKYFCYSLVDDNIANCGQGSLSEPEGTIVFTPTTGDTAYVLITGKDTNGTPFSFKTKKAELQPKTATIKIKFTPAQSSYYRSEDVSVKYKISGGSGVYYNMFYRCDIWDNGRIDTCASGRLSDAKGTIKFKPTYGQAVFVYIEGYDSWGRFFYSQSNKIDLAKRVKPKSTSVSSLSADKGKLTVKWETAKYADGYQIEYSTHKDFSDSKTVTVSGSSKVKKTLRGLESKKRYYVRIRSYKKYNNGTEKVYSKWSSAKSKKTK